MSTFRVGQKVVCVIEDNRNVYTLKVEDGPKKGDELTVSSVYWDNRECLKFVEWGNAGWDSYQFRPIQDLSNTTYNEVMEWIESGKPIEILN